MFTLIFDKETTRAVGTGQYSYQASLDDHEVECSQEQFNNFSDYIFKNGKIVKSPRIVDLDAV